MSRGHRQVEKRSHGYPIQIYTEAVNVGKSLQGTKKRIKWRFGWTESPEEQEVELVHSLVSGKKTIYEDGNEVHSVTSVTSMTFNHAWHSHGLYVYRIEMIASMLEEPVYIFSIDGVRFFDWKRKGVARRVEEKRNAGRYNDDDAENNDDYSARGSGQGAAARRPGGPAQRQPQQQQQQQQQQHPQRQQRQPPQWRSEADSDGYSQPPAAASRSAPPPQDDGTFDPFAPSSAATRSFDPFAPEGGSSSAAAPAAPAARGRAASNNSVGAGRSASFVNFDEPLAPVSASAAFDAFAPSVAADPFESSAPAAASRAAPSNSFSDFPPAPPVPKARTASADLLSTDFAGLSFAQQPSAPLQALSAPPALPATPAPAAPQGSAGGSPVEAFGLPSNLVSLDLAPRGTAPSSSLGGPSLNSMLGAGAGGGIPPSRFQPMQGGAFANAPAPLPLASKTADPFGAPALMAPSALPVPAGPAAYGAGLAPGGRAPPVNPFAGLRPAAAPAAGLGAGGLTSPPIPSFLRPGATGAAAPAPTRGLPPSAFSGAGATGPKSSLDSIDWRASN